MTEKSLREQLEEHFDVAEVDAAQDQTDEKVVEAVVETEELPEPEKSTPAVEKLETETPVIEEKPAAPLVDAPQAWTAEAKSEWSKLPANIQAEITRRENDFHKMVTKHDGELRFGRSMKEAYAPFEGTLQKYGAEPVSLMKELLGTVQALKEGDQATKLQIMQNIAQAYGVDMSGFSMPQVNPLDMVIREIQSMKTAYNPDAIINQLQEHQEFDRINAEIQAFAAKPESKYFELVKPVMQELFNLGEANNLQEAYDKACDKFGLPRSTMQQPVAAKQKADLVQKKNAAVSIKGSPSVISGNQNPPSRNLREELAANLDAAFSSKI